MDEKLISKLSVACMQAHQSTLRYAAKFDRILKRKVYVTPKSFIDLLDSFNELLTEKFEEINDDNQKLNLGVVKLQESEKIVSSLQEELVKLQPELEVQNREQEKLIAKI